MLHTNAVTELFKSTQWLYLFSPNCNKHLADLLVRLSLFSAMNGFWERLLSLVLEIVVIVIEVSLLLFIVISITLIKYHLHFLWVSVLLGPPQCSTFLIILASIDLFTCNSVLNGKLYYLNRSEIVAVLTLDPEGPHVFHSPSSEEVPVVCSMLFLC